MKRLALVAGVIFLLLGIAGFAGLYAANAMHSAVYVAAGMLGVMFGVTHRRGAVPPHSAGPDLRDF
jgi:hypothetical protein